MTAFTLKALTLIVLASFVGRLAMRFADWTVPPELNYRFAAFAARLALRLAHSPSQRAEAADALANVLARDGDGPALKDPLSAVRPVVTRCLLAEMSRNTSRLLRGAAVTLPRSSDEDIDFLLVVTTVLMRIGIVAAVAVSTFTDASLGRWHGLGRWLGNIGLAELAAIMTGLVLAWITTVQSD